MKITIDTNEPLSLTDSKILQMLLDETDLSTFKPVTDAKVRLLDEEVGPHGGTVEVEEPEDDGVSKEVAVARATALIADGKAAEVKAALETAGAKRVNNLTDDQIPAFLRALDA